MRNGDAWIVACAVATAGELGLRDLRPEIEPLSRKAGADVVNGRPIRACRVRLEEQLDTDMRD